MRPVFRISVLFRSLLFSSLVMYSVPQCGAAIAPARVIRFAAAIAGPLNCAAALVPGRAARTALISVPRTCAAGVMDQLCSSVMSFLDDEAAKAGADAKACKKNCNWKKRKKELVDAAKKKAKESCARGEAPDINEINKGLDGNAKARLKNLYDNSGRMFDGKAKLPGRDFAPESSRQAAVLSGKGGKVADLKSSEPDIQKLARATVFSLDGIGSPAGQAGSPVKAQPASPPVPSPLKSGSRPAAAASAGDAGGSGASTAAGNSISAAAPAAASTACPAISLICAIKDSIVIDLNTAIFQTEAAAAKLDGPLETAKKACAAKPEKEREACVAASVTPLEKQITNLKQSIQCLKDTRSRLLAKCGGVCPDICACTLSDCKDADSGMNSASCRNACKKKKVCVPQMEQCPKDWDRTFWNPIDQAIEWAWSNIGNPNYGVALCGGKIAFCARPKCNLFLADVFIKGGGVDFPGRKGRIFTTPESANTLANPNEVLSHYPVIKGGKDALQRGDIIAFPGRDHGHVMVYIGKNVQGQDEVIYAARWKVVKKLLNDVVEEFEDPFTVRRYTP